MHAEAEIATMGRADLKTLEDGNMGLAGSPTKIAKASEQSKKRCWRENHTGYRRSCFLSVGKMTEKHVCGL